MAAERAGLQGSEAFQHVARGQLDATAATTGLQKPIQSRRSADGRTTFLFLGNTFLSKFHLLKLC